METLMRGRDLSSAGVYVAASLRQFERSASLAASDRRPDVSPELRKALRKAARLMADARRTLEAV